MTTETEALPEPEIETYVCDACGEAHDRGDDEETVLDSDGLIAVARSSCADGGDYSQVDFTTNRESRAGVVRVDNDIIVWVSDVGPSATPDYASGHWYYSEQENSYFQEYFDSPEARQEREEEEEEESADMFDYGTDILDVHGWPDATPHAALCFGVELECEANDCDVSDVTSALGGKRSNDDQYILKYDGSLTDGVEIVTLPYTLDYHQAKFGWRKVLAPLAGIAKSGNGTSSCGIHVHINRAAISALTLGKMLVFVNDPRNVRAISGIAQRSESSWARFIEKKFTDGIKGKATGERYQALNVTDNTIEVRIFRGNLRPERVLKNLEFCHALVSYCRTASMQALTWPEFWAWLRATPANRKQYGNLIDFAYSLVARGVALDADKQTDKDI